MKGGSNRQGFISLHRAVLDWEWYGDINTSRLFIHLLLTAEYKDTTWRGRPIKRGQRACSLAELSKETRLTIRQTRTSLSRLQTTREVSCEKSSIGTVITINSYDKYQTATREMAVERQANDTPNDTPIDTHTLSNKYNKYNNIPPISPKGDLDLFEKYSCGDTELLDALKAFEQMRTKIKKPMTDRAKIILLNKLDRLANAPEQKIVMLDEAVLHCWQSVYPPKAKTEECDDEKEYY